MENIPGRIDDLAAKERAALERHKITGTPDKYKELQKIKAAQAGFDYSMLLSEQGEGAHELNEKHKELQEKVKNAIKELEEFEATLNDRDSSEFEAILDKAKQKKE